MKFRHNQLSVRFGQMDARLDNIVARKNEWGTVQTEEWYKVQKEHTTQQQHMYTAGHTPTDTTQSKQGTGCGERAR